MSFQGLLKDAVTVYARTPESDVWAMVGTGLRPLPCKLTPLSASGARRESRLAEPDVTHTCRMLPNAAVAAGQRLQRASDGQEFVVRSVRTQSHPVPGQMILGVAEVANAIT